MGELSLSELLGKGIGDGDGPPLCPDEPELAGRSTRELVKLMRSRSVPHEGKDRVLAAAIRCYRRHPDRKSSDLVLALLSPVLIHRVRGIEKVYTKVEKADLRQQVVMETLKAVATMTIPERSVRREVERRIFKYVRRWLDRTTRTKEVHEYDIGEEDELSAAQMNGVLERLDLEQLGIAMDDLRLAFRSVVGGETATKLALECGLAPSTVSARVHRVLRQLRSARPEFFERHAPMTGSAA